MGLLQMSLSGAVLIAAILIVRAATINRLPKVTFLILWEIAILRLLVPLSLPSSFSVYSLLGDSRAVSTLEERISGAEVISEKNTEMTLNTGSEGSSGLIETNVADGEAAGTAFENAGSEDISDVNAAEAGADKTMSLVTADADAEETAGSAGTSASETEGDVSSESNKAGSTVVAFLSVVPAGRLVWLAGVLACAAFFILSYGRSRLKFSFSMPVQNAYTERWLSQHALRRTVSVRQTDLISAPLTYGIFHPVILMPAQTDWEDARHLDYIFAHEYHHIRRFDTLKKIICVLALCIHWFNPFVWLLYFLYNRDIELACDESVIRSFGESSRREYSLMLLSMEAKKSGLLPLCNHFSKNSIEARIRAIMKTKKMTAGIAAVSVAIIVVIAALFATSASDETGNSQTAEADGTKNAGAEEMLADADGTQDEEGTGNKTAGTENTGAGTEASPADAGTAEGDEAEADAVLAISVTGSAVSKEENAVLYEQIGQLLAQRDLLESEMRGAIAIDLNITITVDGVTYCLVTEEGITSFGDYEALAEEIYTEDYVARLFTPQESGYFSEADGRLYRVNADSGFISIDEDSICVCQQGGTDGIYIVTANTDTSVIPVSSTTMIFVIQMNEEKPYGLEIRDEIQFCESTLEEVSPVAQEENAGLYEQIGQLLAQRDLLETEMNLGGETDQYTTVTVDGDPYYALVTREGIHTWSDYEALAEEVYTESYVSRIFTPVYSGLYAEVDGSLYRAMADGFAQTADEEAGISIYERSGSDGVYIVIGYTDVDDTDTRSTLIFIIQENKENTFGFEIRDVIVISA